jgi:hypothetical protein
MGALFVLIIVLSIVGMCGSHERAAWGERCRIKGGVPISVECLCVVSAATIEVQ